MTWPQAFVAAVSSICLAAFFIVLIRSEGKK